jgi:hypothetical protein
MAIDRKYGRVTLERGTVGDDEPVVVFRAQDRLLPAVLDVYLVLGDMTGCDINHLDAIDEARQFVENWQGDHPDDVKIPDTTPAADGH